MIESDVLRYGRTLLRSKRFVAVEACKYLSRQQWGRELGMDKRSYSGNADVFA
jgi:hypothetical protein